MLLEGDLIYVGILVVDNLTTQLWLYDVLTSVTALVSSVLSPALDNPRSAVVYFLLKSATTNKESTFHMFNP